MKIPRGDVLVTLRLPDLLELLCDGVPTNTDLIEEPFTKTKE